MKFFMDMEFTGLHQKTTPISLAIVSQDNYKFYAEFTDYDKSQVNDWINKNVISKLILTKETGRYEELEGNPDLTTVLGNTKLIRASLSNWLLNFKFDTIEIWSDCLAYDWVVFCELFGGSMNLPENILYIPFDISTLFRLKNVNPDISREQFSKLITPYGKHNSLHDAMVVKHCYYKLIWM